MEVGIPSPSSNFFNKGDSTVAKKDSKTDQKHTKMKGDKLRRPRAHGAKRRGFR